MKIAVPFIIAATLIVSTTSFAGLCKQDIKKINGYNVTLTNDCQVNANDISCGKARPGSNIFLNNRELPWLDHGIHVFTRSKTGYRSHGNSL